MTRYVRLWLGGFAIRVTLLAVPPLLPLIGTDFHLSATDVAVLTGLPVLMLGIAALLGAVLVSRYGAGRSVCLGLLLASTGAALRSAAPTPLVLDLATFVMGAGIAAVQPALAALVRTWLPGRVAFGTAIYTNGLLFGEILPAGLTGPLVLPALGESWRWALLAWSLSIVVIALLFVRPPRGEIGVQKSGRAAAAPTRWWPDWRSKTLWRVGFLFACTNTTYFGSNAFVPALLHGRGQDAYLTAVLFWLNVGQLPASLLLLGVADRLAGRALPFVIAGSLATLSIIGMATTSGYWIAASGGLLGFSCAIGVVAGLAMPPFLAAAADVPRAASGMFTISYGAAVLVTLACGRLWDATGTPYAAFGPLAACGVLQVVLAVIRPFRPVAEDVSPATQDAAARASALR